MKYVTRVKSNLKGGVDAKINTRHVLLVGQNGSGKTAITTSIQLSLGRKVDELGGRRSVSAPDLLKTMTPAGEALWSEVELANGERYCVTHNTKWVQETQPAVNFLVPEVEAALSGSPETFAKLILQYYNLPTPTVDPAVFPEAAQYAHLGFLDGWKQAAATVAACKKRHGLLSKSVDTVEEYVNLGSVDMAPIADTLEDLTIRQATASAAVAGFRLLAMNMLDEVHNDLCLAVGEYLDADIGFDYVCGGRSLLAGFRLAGESTIRPAVSGGEWVRLVAAVSCALADRNPKELNLVVLPDRALSQNNLRSMLSLLLDSTANVFVQTTVGIRSYPGWLVVECHRSV